MKPKYTLKPPKPTPKRFGTGLKRKFLKYLSITGNIGASAERIGISRSAVLSHRRNNTEFDTACREAIDSAVEYLENVAWTRATDGWAETITTKNRDGTPQTKVKHHKPSDALLMFMLSAAAPEKYKQRVTETTRTTTTEDVKEIPEATIIRLIQEGETRAARMRKQPSEPTEPTEPTKPAAKKA